MKKCLFTISLFFSLVAKAEQPLPLVLIDGNIIYQSKINYITAYIGEDKANRIWQSVIYDDYEPKNYDENMEADVQWIYIEKIELQGSLIKVTDTLDRVYFVDKTNGQLKN